MAGRVCSNCRIPLSNFNPKNACPDCIRARADGFILGWFFAFIVVAIIASAAGIWGVRCG